MPLAIPAYADADLQKVFQQIERRLAALEREADSTPGVMPAQIADLRAKVEDLSRGPAYGDEWLGMVGDGPQHRRGLTPDPYPAAGLGTERVTHADGTWRRPLDGLVQVVPESCRPANAPRLVEVLGDFAVASGLSADTANFRKLILPAQPGGWLTKTTDFSHNSTSNWLQVTLDTANEDSDQVCDTTNSKLVCKTAGVYLVTCSMNFASNITGIRQLGVALNGVWGSTGTQLLLLSLPASGSGGAIGAPGLVVVRLAVGDYLTMSSYQNSGGTLAMTAPLFHLGMRWVAP